MRSGASHAVENASKAWVTENALAATSLLTNPEDAGADAAAYDNQNDAYFHAVAESDARVDVALPEKAMMTMPDSPADALETQAMERRLFRLLYEQPSEDNSNEEPTEAERESALMKVRELPEPFVPASPARPEARLSDSVTSPVLGSAPLAPREGGGP